MSDDRFAAAVASTDLLDLARRIIANPARAMVSEANKVAMAHAIERMWELCLEAQVLVFALEMTMPWEREADAEHHERVAVQAAYVRELFAAMSGQTQASTEKETEDGSSHS
jgi:hypothetical protein